MGEIKSVKVDNWGVFFLQKLQNFFNKTDYCDLTLQFRDNSQLKVHRLVLSACTDFFNVLEQTCELMDDALVMPMELQADVVVPIVNFMYTGTLEFELKMYNKLLKTAKEMNMTVLLKLLEAHKRTMEGTSKASQKPGSPKTKGKRITPNSPSVSKLLPPSTMQQAQRRTVIGGTSTPMRRVIAGKPLPGAAVFRQVNNSSVLKMSAKMQRGPTRYESVDHSMNTDAYESSFDAISYESKPLKEEPEEYEEINQSSPTKNRSSPFEQLRKGYNNNKRPAVSSFTSPPAKRPNIEDVKEFSEQQRMRKQIAAEYGDDAEYDGILDDEFHNDDDDDEPNTAGGGPSSSSTTPKQQQQQQQQGAQPQASIIIKQSPNEKPTIVVKDSTNSKMDHAKIISEVLRQYPHLVKSNKNIKLKIMPNIGGQTQKIVVKKETIDSVSAELDQTKTVAAAGAQQARQQLLQLSQKQQSLIKPSSTKLILTGKPEVVPAAAAAATAAVSTSSSAPPQKRRIDSKTMHALIALGAENTTGPWLCLRCGVNGRPISIPSYRGFRRHLINTHKETIDSALCEHCGWRSTNNRTLNHHILVEHKISSPLYVFPKCEHCTKICLDPNDLEAHIAQVHPDSHKQQCIYCNKVFSKEMLLYNHMKTFHKKRAREDGVIDFSDDELNDFDDDLVPEESTVDKKIKILSDISLPSTILKLDEIPAAAIEEDYANDSGPKFVNADGNEMVLTAEQREEIMSQLDQDHEGGVVMVLNDATFPPTESVVVGDVGGEGKQQEGSQNLEEYDDHQIYNEFPAEGEPGFAGNDTSTEESALDVNKGEAEESHEYQESDRDERMDEDDHMEWAENVISAHDANDDEEDEVMEEDADEGEEAKEKTTKVDSTKDDEEKVSSSKGSSSDTAKEETKDLKKEDDINLKLKMLTGDWSDDEIDDEDVEDDIPAVPESEKESTSEKPTESVEDDVVEKTTVKHDDEKEAQEGTPNEDENDEDKTKSTETTAAAVEEDPLESEKSEKSESSVKETPEEEEHLPADSTTTTTAPDSEDAAVSEPTTTGTAVEAKDKQKPSSSSKETTPRRKSSLKDVDAEQTTEAEKSINDLLDDDDDPLNEKADASLKNKTEGEDPLAVAETDDDNKKSPETKSSAKDDTVAANDSIEESLKTVDKVKSLISEWADDEDDI